MKALGTVSPTNEQLKLILNTRAGVSVVRGAAGSGKTTAALLRLKFLAEFRRNNLIRKTRGGPVPPLRFLVFTFNRTLRGYIKALADEQLSDAVQAELTVSTFGKWAVEILGRPSVLDDAACSAMIAAHRGSLPYEPDFLKDEVDYILGRFLPGDLGAYVTTQRHGRDAAPRVDRAMRQRILDELVMPYSKAKREQSAMNWNDVPLALYQLPPAMFYDVIVVDEAQDFSANQVRAAIKYATPDHATTFVLDTVQRIYPRYFTWSEVGVSVAANESHRLARNYRNTAQIAALARSIVNGIAKAIGEGMQSTRKRDAGKNKIISLSPVTANGWIGLLRLISAAMTKRFALEHDPCADPSLPTCVRQIQGLSLM